jgi:hypothetical protein
MAQMVVQHGSDETHRVTSLLAEGIQLDDPRLPQPWCTLFAAGFALGCFFELGGQALHHYQPGIQRIDGVSHPHQNPLLLVDPVGKVD